MEISGTFNKFLRDFRQVLVETGSGDITEISEQDLDDTEFVEQDFRTTDFFDIDLDATEIPEQVSDSTEFSERDWETLEVLDSGTLDVSDSARFFRDLFTFLLVELFELPLVFEAVTKFSLSSISDPVKSEECTLTLDRSPLTLTVGFGEEGMISSSSEDSGMIFFDSLLKFAPVNTGGYGCV